MNKTMKKISKRIISLFVIICIVLAMTACGNGKGETGDENSKAENSSAAGNGGEAEASDPGTVPEPEAVLDPEEIDWGYEAVGSQDAQHWYPDGDKLADYYIIFDDYSYLIVDDGEGRSEFETKTENKHIVTFNEGDPVVDFVFVDNFACYDLKGEQWYMRADYNAVMDSLTSATFYCEVGDQWNITFRDDGTYSFDRDGDVIEGDWWLKDANTIEYNDDYGTIWFKITYAEDSWEVVSISDTDDFFPRR